MDACILTAIVCKCDEQMDRHVIMILRYNKIINCYKYFTNLVIGIAVGAARHIYIYNIFTYYLQYCAVGTNFGGNSRDNHHWELRTMNLSHWDRKG